MVDLQVLIPCVHNLFSPSELFHHLLCMENTIAALDIMGKMPKYNFLSNMRCLSLSSANQSSYAIFLIKHRIQVSSSFQFYFHLFILNLNFFYSLTMQCGMCDLSSLTTDKPVPLAWGLNHWITRRSLSFLLLIKLFFLFSNMTMFLTWQHFLYKLCTMKCTHFKCTVHWDWANVHNQVI